MDAPSFDIDKLIEISRAKDATIVGVFGSVARGVDTLGSDIDLMVKFSIRKSLSDDLKSQFPHVPWQDIDGIEWQIP